MLVPLTGRACEDGARRGMSRVTLAPGAQSPAPDAVQDHLALTHSKLSQILQSGGFWFARGCHQHRSVSVPALLAGTALVENLDLNIHF